MKDKMKSAHPIFRKPEKTLNEGLEQTSKAEALPIGATLQREDLLKLPVTVLVDAMLKRFYCVSLI
eukprot:CAMPEP_0185261130 /NCGR_PEP_ID=MMETSP1359-20130426/9587_1 /TAXON_ID=552665 /ORGANISM="Bigelowiella longifila, Strain CCMP242" /LENGTH=65 /DNA_ID=CAMNT_0027847635 /DNA_START=53 /DNA_END=250 /DNA_ORIENTATION=+